MNALTCEYASITCERLNACRTVDQIANRRTGTIFDNRLQIANRRTGTNCSQPMTNCKSQNRHQSLTGDGKLQIEGQIAGPAPIPHNRWQIANRRTGTDCSQPMANCKSQDRHQLLTADGKLQIAGPAPIA
jgi:hypothetical protein